MTYVVAIDQGTTSTRAMLFNAQGLPVASGQLEHRQYFPHPGWVEHDAIEIWRNTREVIGVALAHADVTRHEIAAVGIANQRETVVVWDKLTGVPIHPAIVWQDTRTQNHVDALARDGGEDRFKELTGLPLATYFSATKIAWILDHVDGARELAARGDLLCGTIDSWLIWNLTGGPDGGVHATDVTNASRTLLMDLSTLEWSEDQLDIFGIPRSMMAEIRPSCALYGTIESSSLLREVPIAGVLGDQQAATFGQAAFDKGDSKNTYGTGNFLIVNTGDELVASRHGLISTVAYQCEGQAPRYALEGSIAVTGSLVQWLRDSLGLFENASDIEALAASVDDSGGVVIVPAFSGLYAPYWRSDARGAILGLTRYVNRAHIARAALEAVAFQSREVIEAAQADTHTQIAELKVDGGMVVNTLLLQLQADLWGKPVVRPKVGETTALGAAYAAGLTVGFWQDLDQLRELWHEDARWESSIGAAERATRVAQWHKAVTRTFDWVD